MKRMSLPLLFVGLLLLLALALAACGGTASAPEEVAPTAETAAEEPARIDVAKREIAVRDGRLGAAAAIARRTRF